MISCEKENLKNLILDMANRLHSDVAVTCVHWPGMSPSAYSLSLTSNTALGPGEDRLAPSFLLPAVSCLFTSFCLHLEWHFERSAMQGMGSFSLPTLVSSPGSVISYMVSSWSSHFFCCPIFLAVSHFESETIHAEVSENFSLSLDSLLWWLWPISAVA